MVVINVEVARGWKAIARMIGGSVSTAQRLYRRQGLPVVYEGQSPTMDTKSYLEWRENLGRHKVKNLD
ncbi:MAG: hypothetical protein JRI95_05040 [Deltaproteobacteria bacterium]|nr:hypothetical protein [Deltaproteobacteria bacterium]MBW2086421.1 hypothetical protein [Deltaproteobacteria bacterium]